MNTSTFTRFFSLKTQHRKNQHMKNSITKFLLPAAFMLLLGFVSTTAQAQCDPKVELRDGTKGTTATWCMNELIQFYENSPGYNTTVSWDFGDGTTSTLKNPQKSYSTSGTFTVKFSGTGPAGQCNKDLTLHIEPSPEIDVKLLVPDTQCFEGNQFCFEDNSFTVPTSSIVRMTYLFSDGGRIDTLNPVFPVNFCYGFIDQSGGYFDMTIEAEDANGCVTKIKYSDYLFVTPKLGIEFLNKTPAPNPGCDSTLGRFQNISLIGLQDIASFCWDFGESGSPNNIVCGDSITNTDWWYGNASGFVEHMYHTNGSFNGSLTVTSKFGCTETFTWKAAVANIVLRPVILSDKDSSCAPDNPVAFWLKDGPVPSATAWLWNFGDPPSGPANFDNKNWEVEHSYGTGPWMISLRIIAGPCDVTVYDTITKIGPGSTIEVPFVRVAEAETYQCLITDTVRFVNNSSFYHNDANPYDEDSIVWEYSYIFRVKRFPATGFDSLQLLEYEYDELVSVTNYPITGTASAKGYTVTYDSGKDSLKVVYGGNTTYESKAGYGLDPKLRYVFNYNKVTKAGDQTAIPNADPQRGMNPHVWRVWDFGDQYAPQCTTDSRPWVNKNVGINCNWSIDTLPVHWYTPWDQIYRELNNGNFYKTPITRTLFNKALRRCFQVSVYPDSTMVTKGDTVLTIPYGTFYTYQGVTIGTLQGWPAKEFQLGNWTIRRPPAFYEAPKIYLDDSVFVIYRGTDSIRFDQWVTGRDTIMGSFTSTVTDFDMDVKIPAGMKVFIFKLAAAGGGGGGVGTSRTEYGPKTITIKKDEQFTIYDGDSLYAVVKVEVKDNDTTYAKSSKFLLDNGTLIDSFFVDSAYHREEFFLERANCFQVSLWHKDTVHPLMCEATSNKSLALIPPNAKGMEIESGIPCPQDGNNLSYYLTFDMGETKPGCTQQWFAVNFDSLADPNAFIPYNQGVLAPPPPGSPIPFALPYLIVGNKGTKFVKAYAPGEIGNDPSFRKPNGSFTIGLIVGNGQPNPNGGAPSCLDTSWYSDMFRILYLNADFTIVSPTQEIKAICAGGDAYFRINEPIQDSIRTLRWNWGYQGIGRGVNLATYIEQWEYYKPYSGPSPTRNDKDVVYNGEDWLYNYIIRIELSDVLGTRTIDTIVTSIIKDWRIVADKSGADDVVKDLFESIGLYLPDIPEDEVPLYLGPASPPYCIDTTGLSQYFKFGIKPYSERVDSLVFRDGDRRYRYLDASRTNFVEVAQILHFRDSSIQGFDSLQLDTNLDGKLDMLRGLWKYTFKHPVITQDPCDFTKFDTTYVPSNGPMIPSLFLNNTVGCEKRGAALLNVGFLNDFWLDNPNICNGLNIVLEDTLRYWQYGDQQFPDDYPIDPRPFWHTADRYLNNIEYSKVDWDASDGLGPIWERSITPNHTYYDPGTYEITVVSKDSIGCYDTVRLKAYITEVIPGFDISSKFLNCNTIVDFLDTSVVNDPCLISADCEDAQPCDSVIRWEWDFGDGTRKSLLKNPSHDYTQGGYFDVTLTVWTVLGCEESITKRIYIPGPDPEFEFELEVYNDRDSAVICVGDSITLRNLSGGDKISPEWEMRWGDGGISNPGDSGTLYGHRYDSVGTFELYLVQFDEIPGENIRCNRIFPDTNPDLVTLRKIKVVVLPRAEAEMEIKDIVLCPDEVTEFIAHVASVYTTYSWDFGDGDTINKSYPDSVATHSFKSSGVYNIKLTPNYTPPQFIPSCPDTAYGQVTVVDVFASFKVDSTDKPEFCFTNESTGATSYNWTFEDEGAPGSSTETNPCYNWSDRVGDWEVCLTAISPEGCEDDTCIIVPNRFQRKLIVYNIFTPPAENGAGDGMNDEFIVEGKGLETFDIKIYNRWGERVFHSESVDISWNGRVNNDGALCPDGTYFYVINYKFLFENENEDLGPIESSVDLVRQQ